MRRCLVVVLAAVALTACTDATGERVATLQRQLAERDAAIAALRRQLSEVRRGADADTVADASTPGGPAAQTGTTPAAETGGSDASEAAADDLGTRALEEALVRRGTQLLPPGVVQIEPELSYFYEDLGAERRDTIGTAVTARVGLPWTLQAEVRVPYVLHDHLSGDGTSAGLGDIAVGLSKQLVSETDAVPALLLTGRWWANTGHRERPFATGIGAHAFQAQLTASKAIDPVVLFGGVNYTFFSDDGPVDYGDVVGGSAGAYLAATPDVSLYLVIDASSNALDRFAGEPLAGSSRLSGVVELGAAATLRRDLFLNVAAGLGFTRSAPDFNVIVSLPMRF